MRPRFNHSKVFFGHQHFFRRRHALQLKQLGQHSTDLQKTKALEHGNALKRRFDAWVAVQGVYMPSVTSYRRQVDAPSVLSGTAASIIDARLMLPSEVVTVVDYEPILSLYEFKFRVAQGYSTLGSICGLLLSRSLLLNVKKKHVSGQVQVTRSEALIQTLTKDISQNADKYRYAYTCMQKLVTKVPPKDAAMLGAFKPLEAKDLTGLTSLDVGAEGHKRLSWIWTVRGVEKGQEDVTETCTYRLLSAPHQHELIRESNRQLYASNSAGHEHAHSVGKRSASCWPRRCVASCDFGSRMRPDGKHWQTNSFPLASKPSPSPEKSFHMTRC